MKLQLSTPPSTTAPALTDSNNIDASVSAKVAAAVERCYANRNAESINNATSTTTCPTTAPASTAQDLRYHRGMLGVLAEIMNPAANSNNNSNTSSGVNIEHGNWGKWNFNGTGPGTYNAPCVGKFGAVVSLPGCKDQTIHADTAHIYEHVHLPPHYLNLFLPCMTDAQLPLRPASAESLSPTSASGVKISASTVAADGEEYVDEEQALRQLLLSTSVTANKTASMSTDANAVSSADSTANSAQCYLQGQTAFAVGSHRMAVAAQVMTHTNAQQLLEARLIRPQLTMGDALLFDCRILHFGLSNWSNLRSAPTAMDDWRVMLYINYHQHWFQDPKNWNDAAKLF